MGRRVDEDGPSRFGRGRGRPWGRVARGFFKSKVETSEWSNFGGERLLGAANGDRPKRRIQVSKSNPIDGGACSLRLRLKLALNPRSGRTAVWGTWRRASSPDELQRCGRLRLPARRNSPHCRRQELCHQTKQVSYDLVRGAGGQLIPIVPTVVTSSLL